MKYTPFNKIVNPRGWYVSKEGCYICCLQDGFVYLGKTVSFSNAGIDNYFPYTGLDARNYIHPYRKVLRGENVIFEGL